MSNGLPDKKHHLIPCSRHPPSSHSPLFKCIYPSLYIPLSLSLTLYLSLPPPCRWKISSYYAERGLLVALAITQDGQKVAKSFTTILCSLLVIAMAALGVTSLRPYLKHKENLYVHMHKCIL